MSRTSTYVSPEMQKYRKLQEEQKREAEWNEKRKRSIWEVTKKACGVISATLSSVNCKGDDRKSYVAVIDELVREGTFVPHEGAEDWKERLLDEACKIKHLGLLFGLKEAEL